MHSGTKISFGVSSSSEAPVLVSFPFGVPLSSVSSSAQVQAFEKPSGKRRKILLEGDIAGVSFQGCNTGVCSTSNDFAGMAIGLYDETTGGIELHSAGHVFALQQVDSGNEFPSSLHSESMNTMERRQSLTDTFGSKKKKRALRAAESNVISAQNIVAADTISEMLIESITDSDTMIEDTSSAAKNAISQHREIMLPPFDISATELKKAYPLIGGLVPRTVAHTLKEWVEKLSNGDFSGSWEHVLGMKTSTVRDISSDKVLQPSHPKFTKLMGNMLLCDIMLLLGSALLETSRPILKDALDEKLSSPPPQVMRHLTDSFAVYRKSNGKAAFVSTKSLIDKLLMHSMVLILHLNDGVINLVSFAEDTNVGSVRANALAKEIGCNLHFGNKADGKKVTATIALPLKFPESRKKMNR